MNAMTKRFIAPHFFLLPLLLAGPAAIPAVGQTVDQLINQSMQRAAQSTVDLPGLVAEAVHVTVQEAKQHAPEGAITGPVFFNPVPLKPSLGTYDSEVFSQASFAEAVQSAYERKADEQAAGSAGGAQPPMIIIDDSREVLNISGDESDPVRSHSSSVTDAGVLVSILSIAPAGESAEITVRAMYNDRTTGWSNRGTSSVQVPMSAVREGGAWRITSKKLLRVVQ